MLRAHFVDKLGAERFGCSLGTFLNLCTGFRKNPDLSGYIAERKPGPKPGTATSGLPSCARGTASPSATSKGGWRRRMRAEFGGLPRELIFDSRPTTEADLAMLDRTGIDFAALRKRTRSLLAGIAAAPETGWRRVRPANVGRMVIVKTIAAAIDFFHMDALSAAVTMKAELDQPPALTAGWLCRLLAPRLGGGRETAGARSQFRDFAEAAAETRIGRAASARRSGAGPTIRSCPMRDSRRWRPGSRGWTAAP